VIDLTGAGSRLVSTEKASRQALIEGCRSDFADIGRLLARPLREAKRMLIEELASCGDLDLALRRNLVREEAANIATRCAWAVFANASVRFRARCRFYACAVAEAEREFLGAACAALGDPVESVHTQRQIVIPHLNLADEARVAPDCDPSADGVDAWIAELQRKLGEALEQQLELAVKAATDRGYASIARCRVALRRACTGTELAL
jgi:hypothetical protein